MKTKIIRDPIHKDIELNELELKILDSKEMQRLRRIKQNGFSFLVYPSLNNTRFEHSIGTMFIAGKIADKLNLDKDEKQDIRIASLLHDVGHLPFSHVSSDVIKKFDRNFSHEENSCNIIRKNFREILNSYGIDVEKICDLIKGKEKFGKIINSDIDADRMDYLLRDSYYAGVAYGIIDIHRIIQCIKFHKNLLVVSSGGIEAVENLLIARNLMYQTVYRHHTKEIAEAMFSRAFEIFLDSMKKNFSNNEIIENLSKIDDYGIENLMENSENEYVREIIQRLKNRDLFKRGYVEKITNIDLKFDVEAVEDKICNSLGIPKNYLLINIPKQEMKEYDTLIEYNGEILNIEEISELAKALKKQEISQLNFYIYVDKKYLSLMKNFVAENFIKVIQRKLIV
ncbi:MAG: HD domain-containing protein [Candidatus Altarchaeaceae archaeon]